MELHFQFRTREPKWEDVDKSTLPLEAFGFPDALVRSGKMSRKNAAEIPRSEWKLPHHFRAEDGRLYPHRRGVQLAIQALGPGIRGNRVILPKTARTSVRAHLRMHEEQLMECIYSDLRGYKV